MGGKGGGRKESRTVAERGVILLALRKRSAGTYVFACAIIHARQSRLSTFPLLFYFSLYLSLFPPLSLFPFHKIEKIHTHTYKYITIVCIYIFIYLFIHLFIKECEYKTLLW